MNRILSWKVQSPASIQPISVIVEMVVNQHFSAKGTGEEGGSMGVRFDFDSEKAIAAVSYIASSGLPGLTKGKICKLIFLADRLHLVRYGRTITGDDLYAMEHGPVPSNTLNLLGALETGINAPDVVRLAEFVALDRRFQYPHVQSLRKPEPDWFSPSDLKVLEEVIHEHGQKTFRELRALTHECDAYKKAWGGRSEHRAVMLFEDLFEDEDPDAIEGAREEMIENASLREAFSS